VNNFAMTIADHIREETNFDIIKGLLEKDVDDKFIADVFRMPIKKVREIIQKIKESSN
jgi:transcription initiation factor IIE alpha subunit